MSTHKEDTELRKQVNEMLSNRCDKKDVDNVVALINRETVKELSEARKWATKADTADQVWQQLDDRIKQLQGEQE